MWRLDGLRTLCLFLLLLCLSVWVRADTYTVTTLDDSGAGSLRQAIADADAHAGADTIVFAPGLSGTINILSTLSLSTDMSIQGPSDAAITVARASSAYGIRVFGVSNGTANGPAVSLSNLTIANGSLTSFYNNNLGAGIYNERSRLSLSRCTLRGNVANGVSDADAIRIGAGLGGAIYNGGTLTMTSCTLSGNMVTQTSNLFGNTVHGLGGAIYNAGMMTLTSCTLAGNGESYSYVYNGIYNAAGSTATITHTILANGSGNVTNAGNAVLTSGGYNLSDDGTGPNSATDLRNTNPRLTALLDWGGPTFTYLPLRGSAAINAGDPTVLPSNDTDQRGLPRVGEGRIDIGAVERQGEYVAQDDAYGTPHDTPLTVAAPGILTNDDQTMPNDPLTILVTGNPAHGQLTLHQDGSFGYTPEAGYIGGDSFAYRLRSASGVMSNIAIVTLAVTSPHANDDNFSGDLYGKSVLTNDTGDGLTAVLVRGPQHARAFILFASGRFEYIQTDENLGLPVADTFTYKVRDKYGVYSNVAIVALNLPLPSPNNDTYTVIQNQTRSLSAPGVMDNDYPSYFISLNALLVSNVTHGSLTFHADGSFVYTPAQGYLGADTFTYKLQDQYGWFSDNTATVTLNVRVNHAPMLTFAPPPAVKAGREWTFTATATDPDLPDDTLTWSLQNALDGMTINAQTGVVAWTPRVGGTYTFGVKVMDAGGLSDTKTVNLNVVSDPNGTATLLITNVVASRVNANTVNVSCTLANLGTGQASPIAFTRCLLNTLAPANGLPRPPASLPSGATQTLTMTFTNPGGIKAGAALFQLAGTYQNPRSGQKLSFSTVGNVNVP